MLSVLFLCYSETERVQETMFIKLNHGDIIEIPHGKGTVQTVRDKQQDNAKDYGHLVFEVLQWYYIQVLSG